MKTVYLVVANQSYNDFACYEWQENIKAFSKKEDAEALKDQLSSILCSSKNKIKSGRVKNTSGQESLENKLTAVGITLKTMPPDGFDVVSMVVE